MKVGITFGAFDLLHAGHILMLAEAKSTCDVLIVGLQTNPQLDRPEKHRPIQSVFERQIQLEACEYVDDVIIYDTERDLENILATQPIDIRILGEEYRDKHNTGEEICEKKGIEIYYNKREHDFSTTELIERIKRGKS